MENQSSSKKKLIWSIIFLLIIIGVIYFFAGKGSPANPSIDTLSNEVEAKQHLIKGLELIQEEKYIEAKDEWEKAIDASDDKETIATANLLIGGHYIFEQDYENAKTHCKEAFDGYPEIRNVDNGGIKVSVELCDKVLEESI